MVRTFCLSKDLFNGYDIDETVRVARGARLIHLAGTVSSSMDLSSLFWILLSGAILRWRSMTLIKTRLHFLVLLYPLFRLVHSIEVTPNSKCFWVCVDDIGNSDINDKYTTKASTDEVVCEDYQLAGPNSTVKGQKWKECLTCELSSAAVDPSSDEIDIYWFICKSPVWEDDCGKFDQEDA